MVKVCDRCDVVVMSLQFHVWIDGLKRSCSCDHFRQSGLVWLEEQSIHVGKFNLEVGRKNILHYPRMTKARGRDLKLSHLVVIKENELANATSCQHLSGDRSDASNADHNHGE